MPYRKKKPEGSASDDAKKSTAEEVRVSDEKEERGGEPEQHADEKEGEED